MNARYVILCDGNGRIFAGVEFFNELIEAMLLFAKRALIWIHPNAVKQSRLIIIHSDNFYIDNTKQATRDCCSDEI